MHYKHILVLMGNKVYLILYIDSSIDVCYFMFYVEGFAQ